MIIESFSGWKKNNAGKWGVNLYQYFEKIAPERIWLHLNEADMDKYNFWQPKPDVDFKWILHPSINDKHVFSIFELRYKVRYIPFKIKLICHSNSKIFAETPCFQKYTISGVGSVSNLFKFEYEIEFGNLDQGTSMMIRYLIPGYLPELIVMSCYNRSNELLEDYHNFLSCIDN